MIEGLPKLRQTRFGGETIVLAAVCAFVLLFSVYPLARLFLEAVAPKGQFGLGVAQDVLSSASTWTAAGHSLVTAIFGTAISLLLGTAFAFLVALTDIRGKQALVFLFLLPLMIPPQVTALSWSQLFGPASPLLITLGLAPPLGAPNPIYSAEGIILLLGIQHAPLVFLAMRAGLRTMPREMIEAARACGAGRAFVVRTVVLPLTTPPLVAGGALAFVSAIGNFGIPALLGIPAGYTTLPVLIFQRLASFGPSIISDVAVLSVVVGLLAFAGFGVQTLLIGRRDYRSVGAPSQSLRYRLGRWRPAAELAAWLVILLVLVAPLAGLVSTSLVTAYGVPLGSRTITFANYAEALFRQDAVIRAFRNSCLLAAGAALALVVVSVPLANFIAWRKSRFLNGLGMAAEVPYALPGIVLAIAMILIFINPVPVFGVSVYNTIWIIFFAYLARFLTLSLRPVIGAAQQSDPALDEAARMTGAGYLLRLRTIIFPLLAPAAAAGAILTFMTSFNELTVSALLWSAGNETLGVVVFNLDDSGNSVLASAVAALTVAAIVAIMAASAGLARYLPRGVLPWTD